MTLISAFLATIPLLTQAVSEATIEHWWNISYAVANPDGVCIYFPTLKLGHLHSD